jgi:hypothetical protein
MRPSKVADLNGVRQQAKTAEDSDPIMLRFIGNGADCYQRQFQAKSVRHVGGDARKAVKERKRAECRTGQLATDGKAHGQQRGHQQLKQGAAPEPERLSQPAKEQMAAFMDGKMHVIEQR